MRKRELIATLIAIQDEPMGVIWFPSHRAVRQAATKEYDRLSRLADLLPEIIEKMKD